MKRKHVTMLALSLFGLIGCMEGPALPGMYPASGKIVFAKGGPLRGGALVRFMPAQLESVEAEAEVEDDGSFVLKSIGNKEGAVPGRYKVVLDPRAPSSRPAAKTAAAKAIIPAKYQSADKTPLEVEVRRESNQFTLTVQ